MPAKMALAGENTCHINMRMRISERSVCSEAYQANTCSKNVREGIQYVDDWIKPFRQSFIGSTPGQIHPLELQLKDR